MASIPDATLFITDGALGLVEPDSASSAIVGVCSGGVAATVYAFTDPDSLKSSLVSGPAVEAAAHKLIVGGGTVYVVPVNASVAGSNGAVTHAGTGASVMTFSGTPLDAYQVRVTIILGGTNPAAGTATFKYSVDGGDNYSAETALPTSGNFPAPGTGLTLQFSAASLVAADTYSADCVAPGYSGTDLTNALNALLNDPRTWRHVHCVGAASSAANQATLATTVGGLLTTAETNYRFTYAIMEMPDLGDGTTGDAASITAFASFAHARVMVCAGFCELTSVLTGRSDRRSAAYVIAARDHKRALGEDMSRVRSGPVPGVVSLGRDERVHRGLDAARFATLRTFVKRAGFFITNGRMMAPVGSDFAYVQLRSIMDVACDAAHTALTNEVGDDLRVNSATATTLPGAIFEQDARSIENDVGAALRDAVVANGAASDASVRVNRTDNIISTSTLRAKVRVLPKAYARFITADIGYENPRLAIAS